MVTFLAGLGLGSVSYFGVYLQEQKVGYASYETSPTVFAGKSAERSRSVTSLKIGLIGSQVDMRIESETITVSGKTQVMKFRTESAGRTQVVNATFGAKEIIAKIDNNGTVSTTNLKIPTDGKIVDDPVALFVGPNALAGQKISFYVFDPTSVALIKNTASQGEAESVNGVSLKPIVIDDPRLTTKVYMTDKGDIAKVWTSLGVEMKPLSKDEALAEVSGGVSPDLAELTAIRPQPALQRPTDLAYLKIKVTSQNLKSVPSASYQKVSKDGEGWILEIRTPKGSKPSSIQAAAKAQPHWTKASHLIPSAQPKFVALAKKQTGNETEVLKAAAKLRRYVNSIMTPDAGVGILRDANEILKTRNGVCRDYAILLATLCRAHGIPTKLVSGMVSFDGTFYYHAWVEVYSAGVWVPFDAIPTTDHFSATHVKLGEGNVDTAFSFTVLSGAKIEVLTQK